MTTKSLMHRHFSVILHNTWLLFYKIKHYVVYLLHASIKSPCLQWWMRLIPSMLQRQLQYWLWPWEKIEENGHFSGWSVRQRPCSVRCCSQSGYLKRKAESMQEQKLLYTLTSQQAEMLRIGRVLWIFKFQRSMMLVEKVVALVGRA